MSLHSHLLQGVAIEIDCKVGGERARLVNSIDTVLSTLTANFHSESHVDVASTDLCRWPSHSVGDGLTVVRAVSSANWSQLVGTATQFGKSIV